VQSVTQDAVAVSNLWVEFFRTGLPGLAIVIGALGTLLTSVLTLRRSTKNGEKALDISEKATTIQQQTNGHLSKLTKDLEDERNARLVTEKELRAVYAVLSARMKMPVADLRTMIREEDTLDLPPKEAPRMRRPVPFPLPKRRRTDRPPAQDRKGDE